MVASLWPHRLPLASVSRRSTSASVKYSRVRRWALGARLGVTVRFTVAGVTSLRCDLAMCFALPVLTTVRTKALLRTVASLAALVINAMFEQRLSESLSNPAMKLTANDHRVDNHAEVSDHSIAGDLDHAGFRVDFDFANMATVRKVEILDCELTARIETLRKVIRQRGQRPHARGEFAHTNCKIGADGAEHASAELDVVFRYFQHMRRQVAAFLDDEIAGHLDGGTCHDHGTRGKAAHAARTIEAVALANANRVEWNAELAGNDL